MALFLVTALLRKSDLNTVNSDHHLNTKTGQRVVSLFALMVRHSADKQTVVSLIPLWLSFLFKSCDLRTLSCDQHLSGGNLAFNKSKERTRHR